MGFIKDKTVKALSFVINKLDARVAGRKKSYNMAAMNRLTSDWMVNPKSADATIIQSLRTMRARSRDLAQNNDYAKRFLAMLKSNVVGHRGILLQNKAKKANGDLDADANLKIVAGWNTWGKKGNCTMCGQYSFIGVLKQIIVSVATDGEILVQKVFDPTSPYLFRIHLIEADYLDENLNDKRRRIRGGVEFDEWGQPIAYHLFQNHPGDADGSSTTGPTHRRLPASEIKHIFLKERPHQTRGVPWFVTPAFRMKQLGEFENSELVASRIGASKMGFFTSPDGVSYEGDDEDESGNLISEAQPGIFEELPPGVEFQAFDPSNPTAGFKDFVQTTLRGIASGLNVSYVNLANDLTGVSFSSIRQGELSDRDHWRLLQFWLIEDVDQLHTDWLGYALTGYAMGGLPPRKMTQFNAPQWKPRGWTWVDPAKEIKANIWAVQNGFKSLSQILSEQGDDLEEVLASIAHEKEVADKYGLILPTLTGEQYQIDKENGMNTKPAKKPKEEASKNEV